MSRPGFAPGYGITAEPEGLLPWTWADERLAGARAYWVASTRPDGGPHAAPVWGLWLGDGVYFSTSRGSRKGLNLARDPRCVVHLESGDEVVIVEGRVEEISLDERIAVLKNAGVSGFAVSIDSLDARRHDNFRHGRGSLEATTDALARLREGCPEFAGWWEAHDVSGVAAGRKSLIHPKQGRLKLEYASFQANDDPALKLVIYTRV